jgi:TPR repeat protein
VRTTGIEGPHRAVSNGARSDQRLACILLFTRAMDAIRVIGLAALLLGAIGGGARADRPVVGGVLGGVEGDRIPSPSRAQHGKCSSGDAWACWNIARWYEVARAGAGKASRYYERACAIRPTREGVPRAGCSDAGHYQASKGKRERARKLYTLGCDSGDELSCWSLAALYRDDRTRSGRRRWRQLMVRGCRLGYTPGCERYGVPRPRDWQEITPEQLEAFRTESRARR